MLISAKVLILFDPKKELLLAGHPFYGIGAALPIGLREANSMPVLSRVEVLSVRGH